MDTITTKMNYSQISKCAITCGGTYTMGGGKDNIICQ